MGTNSSKSSNDDVTPSPKKIISSTADNPDPRSPTPEISRTPLQGKNNSKHNITKNADLRKTFENGSGEEKLIHNNPILSAVIKNHLQFYDPRSPTTDFERTPIVLSNNSDDNTTDKSMLRHQNAITCGSPCLKLDESNESCEEATELSPEVVIPKNLCNGFFDITLNDTLKEEPLGSSTVSNEVIEDDISKEIKKPTQLLETNFDYISENEKFEDSEDSIQDVSTKSEGNLKNVKGFKILEDDPRSPSTGIERTPIVVSKVEDDRVEDMSDDTLIKVLQNTNAELRQTIAKPQEQNGEGLLIYEDEPTELNATPKKAKSTCNSGARTPLSCMKNKTEVTHIRSKSANMLYPKIEKTIPSKTSRRASHIPRLKSLCKPNLGQAVSTLSLKNISKTSSVSGDCENTPPHSHRDIWDKESSIVL